jgi:rod shape-determining protein MreC
VQARDVIAQLLAVDVNPFTRQVVVNRGKDDEVYEGQPVMDGDGVIGQVISVGPTLSRVMLLTDDRSAVPVQVQTKGIRAIAVGKSHSDQLQLINIPDTTEISAGDSLVTSGLGLRFPVGYPVGKVVSVSHHANNRFATVIVQPSARFHRSRQVLLVWPERRRFLKPIKKQFAKQLSHEIKIER